MYHLTQFGVALPANQSRIEAGTGAITAHTLPLPGGGSYDLAGSAQVPRGATRLRLRCDLTADDPAALQTQFNALRQLLGAKRKLHRRWDCADSATEWTWARLEELRAESEPRLPLWLPVELRFLLLSPYWHGTPRTAEHIGASGDILLVNSGNLTAAHARITVTAITAMPDGLTLASSTLGGAGFQWTGALSPADTLRIDTLTRAVTLNNAPAYAQFTPLGDHPAWLPLAPSGNLIAITIPTGSASVVVEWDDAWA